MSHTFEYEVPGYDRVIIIVNGDWSGPAILRWWVKGQVTELEMPGEILRKIASQEGINIINANVDRFLESLRGPAS